MIAALVHSNPNVAQKRPGAESHAASMRRPVTLPGHWQRLKHSNNHAATGSVLKCCSPISSAFSSLAASDYADHAAHKTSSRSRPSHRTYGGLPNWSFDRHLRPPSVLPNRSDVISSDTSEPAAPSSGCNRQLQKLPGNAKFFSSPTSATKSAMTGHPDRLHRRLVTPDQRKGDAIAALPRTQFSDV